MMDTPVCNSSCGLTREVSSSLQLLRESTRPTSSGKDRSLKESPSARNLLQEFRRPTYGEDLSGTESHGATAGFSALQLERLVSSEERKFPEFVFAFGHTNDDNKPILVVTQRRPSYHPPFGYTSRVHITIQQDCSYQVHILLHELESGIVSNEEDVYTQIVNKIFKYIQIVNKIFKCITIRVLPWIRLYTLSKALF